MENILGVGILFVVGSMVDDHDVLCVRSLYVCTILASICRTMRRLASWSPRMRRRGCFLAIIGTVVGTTRPAISHTRIPQVRHVHDAGAGFTSEPLEVEGG